MEKTTASTCSSVFIPQKGIPIKSLCYCCPLNGCLWGKQVPFSSGLHSDTKGTHFLWLLLFAYTLPLSSCLLALTSCQADREFMPTQWQVSDGKALCLKKTLRPLSLTAPSLPCHPLLLFPARPFSLLLMHQQAFQSIFTWFKLSYLQLNEKHWLGRRVTTLLFRWPTWGSFVLQAHVCLTLSVTNSSTVAWGQVNDDP